MHLSGVHMVTHPEPLPEQPIKRYKALLAIAVRRLVALGDIDGADWILANLPPVEKKGIPE